MSIEGSLSGTLSCLALGVFLNCILTTPWTRPTNRKHTNTHETGTKPPLNLTSPTSLDPAHTHTRTHNTCYKIFLTTQLDWPEAVWACNENWFHKIKFSFNLTNFHLGLRICFCSVCINIKYMYIKIYGIFAKVQMQRDSSRSLRFYEHNFLCINHSGFCPLAGSITQYIIGFALRSTSLDLGIRLIKNMGWIKRGIQNSLLAY